MDSQKKKILCLKFEIHLDNLSDCNMCILNLIKWSRSHKFTHMCENLTLICRARSLTIQKLF